MYLCLMINPLKRAVETYLISCNICERPKAGPCSQFESIIVWWGVCKLKSNIYPYISLSWIQQIYYFIIVQFHELGIDLKLRGRLSILPRVLYPIFYSCVQMSYCPRKNTDLVFLGLYLKSCAHCVCFSATGLKQIKKNTYIYIIEYETIKGCQNDSFIRNEKPICRHPKAEVVQTMERFIKPYKIASNRWLALAHNHITTQVSMEKKTIIAATEIANL